MRRILFAIVVLLVLAGCAQEAQRGVRVIKEESSSEEAAVQISGNVIKCRDGTPVGCDFDEDCNEEMMEGFCSIIGSRDPTEPACSKVNCQDNVCVADC